MPNWCENTLTITVATDPALRKSRKEGSDEKAFSNEVETLAELVGLLKGEGTDFSLAKIYPRPPVLAKFISPRGPMSDIVQKTKNTVDVLRGAGLWTSWYEWSLAHWGTKWDVEAKIVALDADHVVYNFESAWSPPAEAIAALARMFPEMTFRLEYAEPGYDAEGRIVYEGGVEIENESWSYGKAHPETKEELDS